MSTFQLDTLIPLMLKQDLMVFRVRRGLEQLGFFQEDFYTDIPEIVGGLMGFKDKELDEVLFDYTMFLEELDIKELQNEGYLESCSVKAFMMLSGREKSGG